jgi:DNA-binding protein HU-beta
MNKSELIAKITKDTNLNKKQVEDVLKSLAETIKNEVIASGEFTLQDVGKFKVNDKPEMERRNPRTGEMFTSPAKKVVKITPAKVLRDAVNA